MALKTIVVLGVTGNQGKSVAERFLQDPSYHVVGITRSAKSSIAKQLQDKGVELREADYNDVDSLKAALSNASVIFSITNYWEPYFRPDLRAEAEKQEISIRKYAYDVEYRQGKNIADAAAATVGSLVANGFLVSTLSHARKCSQGKYTEVYHFDSKADVFPDYVQATYPELAAKMSCIHTGYFTTSWRWAPASWMAKQADSTFQTRFPTDPDKVVPHLDVQTDLGSFVYAVSQMPPGSAYMAAGTQCSWAEYDRIWSKVTGHTATYKQVSVDEMIAVTPDKEIGREIADMFVYSSDPGYDGGMKLLGPEDLEKAGIQCPMTSLEETIRREDWSSLIA